MKHILTLSLANAASALHYFLVVYIASSYLEQFLPATQNGIVFSAAAAIMIFGFIIAPIVLTRMSVRHVSIVLAFISLISVLILASNPSPQIAVALIAIHTAIAPLIAYTLDLFLENATLDDSQTGHVRGLFLTSGNVALIASPLLIGLILDAGNDYSNVFLASAATITLFILLLTIRQHSIVDRKIAHAGSLLTVLHCLIHDKAVRSVLIANLLLQSFYVWVGIYIPLYLHGVLGISWEMLGPLFALMLLPFLLIELPVGFIEDKIRGARFIMTGGFLIMSLSFMALSLITKETSFAFITVILVLTRIGAALIEITAETSFFRNVDGQDVESVGLFRMTRPFGMLISPLVSSLFLLAMPLQYLFIPLGIICLFGIPFALRIRDGVSPEVRTRLCSVR